MNWNRVSVVTGPTEPCVTVSEIKDRVRIDSDFEDGLLVNFIEGAAARIDGPTGIGYALMEQTWRLSLDKFTETIILLGAPIKSVTAVNYVDVEGVNQVVDSADYQLDASTEPVRLTPAFGKTWPGSRDQNGSVWIDYVLGESDRKNVNQDLIDAVSLLVAHRDANRDPVSIGKQAVSIPFTLDSILAEYRQSGVAA